MPCALLLILIDASQAMDMLDQEASEDEGIRKRCEKDKKAWDRPPSYEANVELTSKEKRYRQILDQAAESDEHVREKWNEWEDTITRLTWDEVRYFLCRSRDLRC